MLGFVSQTTDLGRRALAVTLFCARDLDRWIMDVFMSQSEKRKLLLLYHMLANNVQPLHHCCVASTLCTWRVHSLLCTAASRPSLPLSLSPALNDSVGLPRSSTQQLTVRTSLPP